MIYRLKERKGVLTKFGRGTVRVKAYRLLSKVSARIELTTCEESIVGGTPGPSEPDAFKVILDFPTVESIDVFMKALQSIKDDLSKQ